MSREYLRDLNERIVSDPSQIKQLIQDIPKLITKPDYFLVSNLQEEEDKEMLCNVIGTLLKRISISARRSKQAFTSMWDNLKKFLEIVLNYALKMENRSEKIDLIMRQILQLGIKPAVMAVNTCEWLGMDLDIQLGALKYSRGIEHVNITENELNMKTLSLFCEQFKVDDFPKTFLKLLNANSTIIDLFFKKYYNCQVMCQYIISRTDDIPLQVIINLKSLSSNELIKFPCNVVDLLISKIKPLLNSGNAKEQTAVFELLAEISESLDFRTGKLNTISLLVDIVNNYDITVISSDVVLSKYWTFVSAILSSEQRDTLNSLESNIIYTLKAELMTKAKTSICRVISLYWNRIVDKPGLFGLLLDCANANANNKLKWNIAVALMNYKCSAVEFNSAKLFWFKEICGINNYKVMYSWTNLLLKWSVLYQYDLVTSSEDENAIWTCLNHLKTFISANQLNLECEDGENIVESACKLEMILKSILIGPNLKED